VSAQFIERKMFTWNVTMPDGSVKQISNYWSPKFDGVAEEIALVASVEFGVAPAAVALA
jgi:hypothetical protein